MSEPITPVAGQVAKLKATLGGGSADYVFPAVNWKLSVDGKVVDISNFRDGRYKVGTLADATLTFTIVWDSADRPTTSASADLRDGVRGVAKCYVDASKFFSVPVVVSTFDMNNEGVENVLMADVTCGLSGQIIYPLDS